MDLNTPIKQLFGIGPSMAFKLSRLELLTVKDLLYHFPFRYDDFSVIKPATDVQIGEVVTLQGEIWSIKNIFTRSGKVLTQAIFNDSTSPIVLTWFNQSWLTKQIQAGDKLQISGKLTRYKNKLSIIASSWEKLGVTRISHSSSGRVEDHLHTGKLVSVYPETEGLTSKWIRTKINQFLPLVENKITEPLPDFIRDKMIPEAEAIKQIHFPKDWKEVEKSRERLGFDELFYVSLATQKTRIEWNKKPLVEPLKISQKDLKDFLKILPFKLTSAQLRVLKEILNDLTKLQPMNRLIQGEVGSGKTVVATTISYLLHKNGLRTLLMAPTEILAFQHFETISKLLEPFGVTVGIYTGSKKFTHPVIASEAKQSSKSNVEIATSSRSVDMNVTPRNDKFAPDIIVGTHALLSKKLLTEDVGLIIIDEQQRFGVEQRTYLRSRAKLPHFLTMTATPIPRTVALTLYGDLDLSIIDELPKERLKIKTFVVPQRKRDDAYKFIGSRVEDGDQVYIITPLIEESETMQSAKAATLEFERLQKEVFPKLNLGLLHGRLKSKEKEEVMKKFKSKEIDILVSTSVVEVGVDVPNATIMMIESAERFGLSQLHQLRGRIGRGTKQSYCLLFSEIPSRENISRLKNLERIDNGLKLAELDLKIRGGGEIFGSKQSGRFEFKIASFSDLALVEKTREAARKLLQDDPTLDKYPLLKRKLDNVAKEVMPD